MEKGLTVEINELEERANKIYLEKGNCEELKRVEDRIRSLRLERINERVGGGK